jgi:hypothetical protein
MNITFAVERLYETGWLPSSDIDLDKLPSGLRYPTVSAVRKVFADAGATLSLKPHLMFGCWRAEWSSLNSGDELKGTVIGSSEAEAAVYALANLREQQANLIFSAADSV